MSLDPPDVLEYGPQRLADHINSLPGFEIWTTIDGNYQHVGAVLADAVLQSNNNYERNVKHRVQRILSDYRECVSLTDLRRLLQTTTPQEFLDWNGKRKPQTFLDLVDLLSTENVDSEQDMRVWLGLANTREKLMAIRFVGPKTADYLKILVGKPYVAMDRHLLGFLAEAGLNNLNYESGRSIILKAAELMQLNPAHLDHSIWRNMSSRGRKSVYKLVPTKCRQAGPRRSSRCRS